MPWVRLLSHVLNEPHLILPAYLVLLALVLLIQGGPSLVIELLLLLPGLPYTFLDVLTLLHLLQLPNLLHLLEHLGVKSDALCHLLLQVGTRWGLAARVCRSLELKDMKRVSQRVNAHIGLILFTC